MTGVVIVLWYRRSLVDRRRGAPKLTLQFHLVGVVLAGGLHRGDGKLLAWMRRLLPILPHCVATVRMRYSNCTASCRPW